MNTATSRQCHTSRKFIVLFNDYELFKYVTTLSSLKNIRSVDLRTVTMFIVVLVINHYTQ